MKSHISIGTYNTLHTGKSSIMDAKPSIVQSNKYKIFGKGRRVNGKIKMNVQIGEINKSNVSTTDHKPTPD